MTPSPTALVIDDEIQIRRLLRVALEAAGYTVHEATGGQEGLQAVAFRRPDVVLLDLGLPDLDGREVLRRLREWSEVPVVILTVRDSEEEKVAALDSGADDFVTKPFSTLELLARVRAAMRRAHSTNESPVFTAGKLVVDLIARCVTKAGEEVHLTATEYALLRLFIRHAGRVITHRQILREIWGPKAEEQRQYLRVHIGNLRKKIESSSKSPLIQTEPGIGYRFTGTQD